MIKYKDVVQNMNRQDNSLMHKNTIEALCSFGLNSDEASIYLSLLEAEEATVLELSRLTGINRTKVYRLCEKLQQNGFLGRESRWKTTRYVASSPDFLKTKILELESRAEKAKKDYGQLDTLIAKLILSRKNKIKVIHYTGSEEMRQLLWNVTRAKTDLKGFGYRSLSEIAGKLFIVRWWNELTKNNIVTKIIANPGTYEKKEAVDRDTKEKYLQRNYPKWQRTKNLWVSRIMDREVLIINQETFLYNDVYALVQWDKNQVFGVEIYNLAVKKEQEAIFDILWSMSKPYPWKFAPISQSRTPVSQGQALES